MSIDFQYDELYGWSEARETIQLDNHQNIRPLVTQALIELNSYTRKIADSSDEMSFFAKKKDLIF